MSFYIPDKDCLDAFGGFEMSNRSAYPFHEVKVRSVRRLGGWDAN